MSRRRPRVRRLRRRVAGRFGRRRRPAARCPIGPTCPRRTGRASRRSPLPTADFTKPEAFERMSAGAGTSQATPEPRRLLASCRQSRLRGQGELQSRQRAVPEDLGVGAVLDPGFRRPRATVQRPELPGVPSQGRARTSAGAARTTAPSRCSCACRCRRAPMPSRRRSRPRRSSASPSRPMARSSRISPSPGVPAEGEMRIAYEEVPVALGGGETASLRKPTYTIDDLGYGPMAPDVHAVAAGRAADDRRRPARGDPSRRHSRQRRSGRRRWRRNFGHGRAGCTTARPGKTRARAASAGSR